MSRPVLVTGANGHLGNNTCDALLKRGYRVRAMVRSLASARMLDHLKCDSLELCHADLMNCEAVDAAVEGVEGVFHLGAPNTVWSVNPELDIRRPIVEGTRHVIEACQRHRVEKMIFASSASAAGLRSRNGGKFAESDWNLEVHSTLLQAKIDAEQEAWRLVTLGPTQLISLLFPAIIGPGFYRHTPNTKLYQKIIDRKPIAIPKLGFHVIDVRDAALGLVMAYESKTLEGRCIVAGDYVTSMSLFAELREIDGGLRLPKRAIPDALVSIGVAADWLRHKLTGEPRELTQEIAYDLLGVNQQLDTRKMREELVLVPRPLRKTLEDMLNWIRARNIDQDDSIHRRLGDHALATASHS